MQKNEYLARLSYALEQMNYIERQEIIKEIDDHFNEAVAGGMTEEQVSERLGTPETLASTYLESAGIQAPVPAAANTNPVAEQAVNTLMGVLSLIIGIPVISLLCGLLVGAFGASIGMSVGGTAVIVVATAFAGLSFGGLLTIGIGLCIMGIGLILLCVAGVRSLVRSVKWYAKAVGNAFKHGKFSEVE